MFHRCLVTTLMCLALPARADVPTLDELESGVIAYRQENYGSGFVEILRAKTKMGVPAGGFRYRIWFGSQGIRFDWRARTRDAESEHEYQIAIAKDKYIWNPPTEVMTTVAPIDEYPDVREHFGVFEPRLMGLGVNSVIHLRNENASQLLHGNLERRNVEIERDAIHDQDAWRIRYELHEGLGSSWSIWIVPDHGFAVVRTIGDFTLPDGKHAVHTMATDYAEAGRDLVWFPIKLHRTYTLDGQLLEEEEVTVQDVMLGGEPSPNLFQLEGMNIPEGKGITDRTKNRLHDADLRWTAGQAVEIPPEPGVVQVDYAPIEPAHVPQWQVVLLWINGAVFLAIAGYGTIRLLRR